MYRKVQFLEYTHFFASGGPNLDLSETIIEAISEWFRRSFLFFSFSSILVAPEISQIVWGPRTIRRTGTRNSAVETRLLLARLVI